MLLISMPINNPEIKSSTDLQLVICSTSEDRSSKILDKLPAGSNNALRKLETKVCSSISADIECLNTDLLTIKSNNSPVITVWMRRTFPSTISTHFVCVPGRQTNPLYLGSRSKNPDI